MTDLNIYLGVITFAYVYFTFYSLACKFADINRWTEYLAMFFIHPFLWAGMFIVLACNTIYCMFKIVYEKLNKIWITKKGGNDIVKP
jgi:hypothetical protein